MRRGVPLLLAALLAGCASAGPDPFAYMRKPLYAGGFDLADLAGGEETQEFRVTDGSIGLLHVLVWVNATAGEASARLTTPSGAQAFEADGASEGRLPLELGVWRVDAQATPGAAGLMHVLVVRG